MVLDVSLVGGVGHYCVFSKLKALENQLGLQKKTRFERTQLLVKTRSKDIVL